MATLTRTISIPVRDPARLAQAGDIYAVKSSFRTAANVHYVPGDAFEIIERTQDAPHGVTNSAGNLRVKCKQGESVWSCFEDGIAIGLVELQAAGGVQ